MGVMTGVTGVTGYLEVGYGDYLRGMMEDTSFWLADWCKRS